MKAITINGSPRKGWNTDMIFQQALKGASDAGAEIHGSVNSCFFFTMNASKMFAKTAYHSVMKQYSDDMKRLGGNSEYYAACDTLQFEDYSKFATGTFNEEHKHKMRKEQFPKDLQTAYDIGFRLEVFDRNGVK